jgi:Leu/Phe-tRNA-protein transferase
LQSLGAVGISRADYHKKLRHALRNNGDFLNRDYSVNASDIAQRKTQTS